jgi:hypothetical protein
MTQTSQIAAEMTRIRTLTADRMGVPADVHAARTAAAQALEAKLLPDFRAKLIDRLTVATLRKLARDCRANTRGCRVRADFERAILKVWRAEVWDVAGYRYGPRPAPFFRPTETQAVDVIVDNDKR